MPRVAIEWRSASKENYKLFSKKYPHIELTFDEWKNIIYLFNEQFKEYILETGFKAKLPFGFGEFTVNKKKRKHIVEKDGVKFFNAAIDWKKTKEKGKYIYNLNYDTEGYFFGWKWFKPTARFRHSDLWYFKPCRGTSRLINHYITTDPTYADKYCDWRKKIT